MLNQVETRNEKQHPVTFTMPSEHIRFSRSYKQVFNNGNSLSRCRVIWKGEFVAMIYKRSTEKMWGAIYVDQEPETVEFSTLRAAKTWLKTETKKVEFMNKLDRLAKKVSLKFHRTGQNEYDISYDGKELGFCYQPSYDDCRRSCLVITNDEFIKMIPDQKTTHEFDLMWKVKEFLNEYIH